MARRDPGDDADPNTPEEVPPAIEQQIDANLRRLYRASLDDELPDHLRDLLERLKAQEQRDD